MSVTERSVVGPKGRIVIPKRFRDEMGIEEGDELIFATRGPGALAVTTRQALIDAIAGSWSDAEVSLVDELFADRAAEVAEDG